jgi:hypothetical protein
MMMRKVFLLCISTLIYLTCFVPDLSAAASIQVVVNGQYVAFPDEPPYLDGASNRMMVPVRFVAEQLGAKVQWNEPLHQVTMTKQDQTISISLGQPPAVIKNNRMMVPLRFISEKLGAQVDWLPERQLVNVTTSEHREPKATWIWDSEIIETEQEKILKFAVDHRLTAIYLHIDKDVTPSVYQSFIRRANEKGIQVEALAGKPSWAKTYNRALIQQFISWVQQYNATVDPKEKFQGLHFDIEPYILDEWRTNPRQVTQNWMEAMRFIESEAKGAGLPVTLDVPFWIYTIKISDTNEVLSTWLLEKFDRVVLMDYRNAALGNDGIVENAKMILQQAAQLHKQVIIAVDTTKNEANNQTTFYSFSGEEMEKELQVAKPIVSQYPSFAGYGIHDYDHWAVLDGMK